MHAGGVIHELSNATAAGQDQRGEAGGTDSEASPSIGLQSNRGTSL